MQLYKILVKGRGSKRYGSNFFGDEVFYVVAPNIHRAEQGIKRIISRNFTGRTDVTEIKKLADKFPGGEDERVVDQLLLVGL